MNPLEADTLIGHGRIRHFLATALTARRHHAYLFTGAAHLGKDTIARVFVGGLIGKEIADWASLAGHPDFAFLVRDEEKKNIGVEEMRGFIAHFYRTSLLGGVKVGVIDGAHELSPEAANALLKTLEEPPGNTVFVLTATDVTRIPATVMSRCQTLRFLPVPVAELREGLERQGIASVQATELAQLSCGRPGVALAFLKDADARTAQEDGVGRFLKLLSAPVAERITVSGELTKDVPVPELRALLDTWTGALRDMICVRAGHPAYVANAAALSALRAASAPRTLAGLARLASAVRRAGMMLQENVNPRLAIEHALLTA